MINTGHATAEDLKCWAKRFANGFHEKSGLELKWEVRRIGIGKEPSGFNCPECYT
jgi:UDP-N-acetylenolpyruvoylglucosamine reductase